MRKTGGKGETNDALQAILGELDGGRKPRAKLKKRIIVVISLILAAAIGAGTFFIVHSKKSGSDEAVYREYTVQRGDIMVGLTESSVITLNKETVTFPVGAEVLEVYIKSGAQVKEGDPLVKMSTDDIADAIADYEDQIKSAKTSVDSAKQNRTDELQKAKQSMDSSLFNSSQSDSVYQQTVSQLQLDLKTAQQELDDAQKKYDDVSAQSKTFSSDLAKLEKYEEQVDTCQDTVDKWTEQDEAYNKVSNKLNQTESKIKAIADASDMEQAEAMLKELQESYDEMKTAYTSGAEVTASSSANGQQGQQSQKVKYSELLKAKEKAETLKDSMDELEDLFDEKAELEDQLDDYDYENISDKLSAAKDALSDAQKTYNDFKEDFTKTYEKIETQDAMDSALRDAENSLERSKLNLQKQNNDYSSSLLKAEQDKSSSQQSGSSAQNAYSLKKLELDQKVEDAQKQYDELVEELQDIKDAVGNNGVITAPCSGIISSLDVEAGDTLTVGGGDSGFGGSSSSTAASLLTITDMSEVNVSISISEDEILDVALDQEASVSIAAFPDETFDGVVDSISVEGATIGAATVTYTVNVKFTQSDYELYDGMSADVTLIQGSAKDVVYVSKQAVTTKEGKAYVLVKGSDGEGVETQVSTGFSDGQYTQIVSGLKQGDVVLVESVLGGSGKSSEKTSTPDLSSFGGSGSFDFPAQGDFPGGKSGESR